MVVYLWNSAVQRRVPSFKAIISVNRYKPIKRKLRLILKAVEACGTLILKSPFLGITVKGHLDFLVNAIENFQVSIKGVRQLVEEVWTIRHLFGS